MNSKIRKQRATANSRDNSAPTDNPVRNTGTDTTMPGTRLESLEPQAKSKDYGYNWPMVIAVAKVTIATAALLTAAGFTVYYAWNINSGVVQANASIQDVKSDVKDVKADVRAANDKLIRVEDNVEEIKNTQQQQQQKEAPKSGHGH